MLITIVIVLILLIISAFFSGSETGLTGASRAKIHKLKNEGNKKALMVHKLHERKDRLISTILLGNNAVNIAASALATSVAIELYGSEGVVYVTIIMTMLVLIFAEVMPKAYAFSNAEKVALKVAPFFNLLIKILYPITFIVQLIADYTMKLFSRDVVYEDESDIDGADALRGAIEMHHDEGEVIKYDRNMLGGVLDLADIEVSEVMIHRKKVEAMNVNSTNDEIVEYVLNSQYSRIPFWEDNPENIIGVMHVKHLIKAIHINKNISDINIKTILKEPWFVPETRNLRDQLSAFRKRHNHLAFVVDEYGDFMGMITLEDILEEIVGQIEDESDTVLSNKIKENDDGSYMVDGFISIRDLNRELDWKLPDDEANTLAGLIIHQSQLIPNEKQIFHFFGYRFEIIKKERNQLTTINCKQL